MVKDSDAINPLVDYVERNLKKGYKLDDLRWALIQQKHSRIEIEKAIAIVQARTAQPKTEIQKQEIKEATQQQIIAPQIKKSFWKRLFNRD